MRARKAGLVNFQPFRITIRTDGRDCIWKRTHLILTGSLDQSCLITLLMGLEAAAGCGARFAFRGRLPTSSTWSKVLRSTSALRAVIFTLHEVPTTGVASCSCSRNTRQVHIGKCLLDIDAT